MQRYTVCNANGDAIAQCDTLAEVQQVLPPGGVYTDGQGGRSYRPDGGVHLVSSQEAQAPFTEAQLMQMVHDSFVRLYNLHHVQLRERAADVKAIVSHVYSVAPGNRGYGVARAEVERIAGLEWDAVTAQPEANPKRRNPEYQRLAAGDFLEVTATPRWLGDTGLRRAYIVAVVHGILVSLEPPDGVRYGEATLSDHHDGSYAIQLSASQNMRPCTLRITRAGPVRNPAASRHKAGEQFTIYGYATNAHGKLEQNNDVREWLDGGGSRSLRTRIAPLTPELLAEIRRSGRHPGVASAHTAGFTGTIYKSHKEAEQDVARLNAAEFARCSR